MTASTPHPRSGENWLRRRGAILVSASSGGHEFPQVNTKAGKTRGASKDHLPAEAIQLTRSMLFAACIQAVTQQGTGWKTFAEFTQARIEKHWRSLQG